MMGSVTMYDTQRDHKLSQITDAMSKLARTIARTQMDTNPMSTPNP